MAINHSTADESIRDALHSVRTLLGMQIAFISEFKGGRRIFRYVDTAEDIRPIIDVGDSNPLEESYCQRVVDGRLPELIRDAQQNPEALTLPVTTALPVGAHLSVPIRFSDGQLYGTFCCFSMSPDATLNDRDIRTLRLFAEITCKLMEQQIEESHSHQLIVDRLQETLDAERFNIVYQPIIHIAQHKIVGYEALTRFLAEPIRPPDVWFNEAAEVGLQEALELAAIRKALQGLARFPDDTYMSLNASPATILKGIPRCGAGGLSPRPPDAGSHRAHFRRRLCSDRRRPEAVAGQWFEAGGGRCRRGLRQFSPYPQVAAGRHQTRCQLDPANRQRYRVPGPRRGADPVRRGNGQQDRRRGGGDRGGTAGFAGIAGQQGAGLSAGTPGLDRCPAVSTRVG